MRSLHLRPISKPRAFPALQATPSQEHLALLSRQFANQPILDFQFSDAALILKFESHDLHILIEQNLPTAKALPSAPLPHAEHTDPTLYLDFGGEDMVWRRAALLKDLKDRHFLALETVNHLLRLRCQDLLPLDFSAYRILSTQDHLLFWWPGE